MSFDGQSRSYTIYTHGDVDLERTLLLEALGKFPGLLITNGLNLPTSTLYLARTSLFGTSTLLFVFLFPAELGTATSLLLLLACSQLDRKLAATSDDGPAKLKRLALRLSSSDKSGEFGLLLFFRQWGGWIERCERVVEARCQAAETGAHNLGGRGLNGAGARHRRGARILDDGERAVDESNTAQSVINTNVELTTAGAAHHICLDLLRIEEA